MGKLTVTNRWPVSPGKVPLLGSPCPPVPVGSTADRRKMEVPNSIAVACKVKDTWVHIQY